MIEILIYIRFGLLWLIPVCILTAIYFGIRQAYNKKFKNKAIISFFSILAIGFIILFYNMILANVILTDVKRNVRTAKLKNYEILLNHKKTDLNISEINEVIDKLNKFPMRNHTHDMERYKITIKRKANDYSFSFYRDSGDESLFWLYTDEYNYELELTNVNTNIFQN